MTEITMHIWLSASPDVRFQKDEKFVQQAHQIGYQCESNNQSGKHRIL